MSNKIMPQEKYTYSTYYNLDSDETLEFKESSNSNHMLIDFNFDANEGLILDLAQVNDLISILNSFKTVLEKNNEK